MCVCAVTFTCQDECAASAVETDSDLTSEKQAVTARGKAAEEERMHVKEEERRAREAEEERVRKEERRAGREREKDGLTDTQTHGH